MKKTVKTSEVLRIYSVIAPAKYSKMGDDDKIKVWKIARKLKPVAVKFEDDSKDAADKMKPYDDFDAKLQAAQKYEQMPANAAMTKEEYDSFIADFKAYRMAVDKALSEFGDKEVEVEFDGLSEDGFGKFAASNDWTVGQATMLSEFLCSND